jgi:hypothetical protein
MSSRAVTLLNVLVTRALDYLIDCFQTPATIQTVIAQVFPSHSGVMIPKAEQAAKEAVLAKSHTHTHILLSTTTYYLLLTTYYLLLLLLLLLLLGT